MKEEEGIALVITSCLDDVVDDDLRMRETESWQNASMNLHSAIHHLC